MSTRHKGLLFSEVVQRDPEFATFISNLSRRTPGGNFNDFQEYLRRTNFVPSARRSRSPRRGNEPIYQPKPADSEPFTLPDHCVVCCDQPVRTAFLPCGHTVCCVSCALEFSGGACPVCRGVNAGVARLRPALARTGKKKFVVQQRRSTIPRPALREEPEDDTPLTWPDRCSTCCRAAPVRALFAPCGHVSSCVRCAFATESCPTCRAPVAHGDVVRLFSC